MMIQFILFGNAANDDCNNDDDDDDDVMIKP